MKKLIFNTLLLSIFLLTGCQNNTTIEKETTDTENNIGIENNSTLEDTILDYIASKYDCNDGSKLFVNYAELGQNNADFYINAIGEGFYIDERGNLNNSCGFSIPMKVTVSTEDGANYVVTDAVQARDGNEYDKSIREMFSDEAIDILYNGNFRFLDGRTLLEMAEEYFGVKIIPEPKNNFECNFCDKIRYYNRTPEDDEKLNQTNDSYSNYTTKDNGKNSIYFGSDGSFEAKNSWDAGKGKRTFGQNENTIIVENESTIHVYDRYIITNQTEDSLNTILEIIQRM